AQLLGFVLPQPAGRTGLTDPDAARTTAPGRAGVPSDASRPTPRGPVSGPSETRPAAPGLDRPGTSERRASVTYLRNLRPVRIDLGLTERPAAGEPLPAEDATARPSLPLIPLLDPLVTPAIVSTMVATDAGDGAIDVASLTDLVAVRRFD